MPETAWDDLKRRMAELRALQGAVALLAWDQETYMPRRGSEARGEQLAALQGVLHERLTDPRLGEALARLAGSLGPDEEPGDPADPTGERRATVRALRFDRERAVRIPGALVRALAVAQSAGLEAWHAARRASDFGRFAPALGTLVGLRREMADALGVPEGGERYDALLDGWEEGMRVARLEPLFQRLTGWLVPLVDRIAAAPPPDTSFLQGRFDADAQWAFTLELMEVLGFDREAGRQDRSVHPFSQAIDPGDVRLTTRIHEHLPLSSIFSTIHEVGHGLYEQGLPHRWRASALGQLQSTGLHESQSRLWENQVGRSLPFWRAMLPRLAARFPQLSGVTPERFHGAINKVERSLVRTESDEATYNLHIVLRFELELALLRGQLEPGDLPAAWNERSRRILGLSPRDDVQGCLQDIHWSGGDFGYFPTYTLGNIYSATLHAAAARALPGLEDEIAAGRLAPLLGWLRTNVHALARSMPAEAIVRRATGTGLDDGDLRRYLTAKYEALYGLS
jgi:carboxypeptidase Taq